MDSQCTVGDMVGCKCHLTTYSKRVGTETLESLDQDTRETLMWRTGLTILNINATVCFHHKYVFLKRYQLQQKACCNPFNLHSSTKKGKH